MIDHMDNNCMDSVMALLACPHCRGDMTWQAHGLACQACRRGYDLHNGIPLLARPGSSELWSDMSEAATSMGYQEQFLKSNIGQRYHDRYRERWSKRLATRREIARIKRLLEYQPRCESILDIPCGGGRVSGPLVAATGMLLQADLSLSQVLMARHTMAGKNRILWFTASAFMIPLRDCAVDGVLCNRLAHHLPCAAEQGRLIHELLRVSKRFVILSYYDHDSFKSLGRRIRGKHPGCTLRRENLRVWAQHCGAFVAADIPLWCRGSRLRYALLQKQSG